MPNEALKSDDMALQINKVHWDGMKFVPRNNCNSRLVVESEDEDYDAYAADDLEDQGPVELTPEANGISPVVKATGPLRRAQVPCINSPYLKFVLNNMLWLIKWTLSIVGNVTATFYLKWEVHSMCDNICKQGMDTCFLDNVDQLELKNFIFKCNDFLIITKEVWIHKCLKGEGLSQ